MIAPNFMNKPTIMSIYYASDMSMISSGDIKEAHNFIRETSLNFLYLWHRPSFKVLYKILPSKKLWFKFSYYSNSINQIPLLNSWTRDIKGQSAGSEVRIGKTEEKRVQATELSLNNFLVPESSLKPILQVCYFPQVWFLQVSLEWGIVCP